MKYIPLPSPPLPNSVVEYQKHLQKNYDKTLYPPSFSRPPYSEHHPEHPLELVLVLENRTKIDRSYIQMLTSIFFGEVDEILRVKKQVKMKEVAIVSQQNKAHFVLIEGAPGIGKSMFCWQLCKLWSEGRLQYKWDLMIIVEIREDSTRSATDVYDLLRHSHGRNIKSVAQSVAKEIEERDGAGLFIIFDGYDEVSEFQNSNQSVVFKILTNELLCEATVVVTSRPNALKHLPPQFIHTLDQHIIIAGFNETDIDTYINESCQSNESLLEHIRSIVNNKPFVRSLMFNPLHCSIIIELFIKYWKLEQTGFAPDTLAQLYTALLINLLQHDLQSNKLDSFDDLPQDVYKNLMKLAKLAADGLENKTYQYDSYHVPNDTLGLMVPTYQPDGVIIDKKSRKYMFLYLTLQEYLSARHWYNQPNQSLIHFLQQQDIFSTMEVHYKAIRQDKKPQHSHQWPHLSVIFLAGLMGDSFPLELIMAKNTSDVIFSAGLLCQLLFEHQSPKHVSKMFANKIVSTDYLDTTPLYNFAIGYCIANSGNTTSWNVDMYDQRSPQYLKVLSDGMHSVNVTNWDERFGPLINLTLEESASGCYLKIFQDLFPFTKAITELHLYGSIADEKGISSSVLQNLSHYCPRLTSLYLPGLNFDLKEAPHLPYETLVTLQLTVPDCSLLLDRLLDYKALRQLRLFATDE